VCGADVYRTTPVSHEEDERPRAAPGAVMTEREMNTWMRLMANDGSIVFGRVENDYLLEYE
jgi:hypothetical protein